MRSVAAVVLAFALGFAVMWWWRSSGASDDAVVAARRARPGSTVSGPGAPGRRSSQGTRLRALVPEIHEVVRPPTDLERLVMEDTQWATPLMRMALESELDLGRARDCFEGGEIAGEVVVELTWQVVSSADEARAIEPRFAGQRSGQSLPAHVVSCIEERLAGTYTARAERGPFPQFEGELPVVVTWVLPEASARQSP